MFTERTALEKLFNQLETSREIRYQQYLSEIREIESKQAKLLEDLKRIDAESHIHSELIEAKREEMAALRDTKKNLAAMNQQIVAPPSENEEKSVAKSTLDESKPAGVTVSATKPVVTDGKKVYPGGMTSYQAYYICGSCKDKRRIYVTAATQETYCRACQKKIKIKHSMSKGFPHRDGYGNYFVGGDFIREEERAAQFGIKPNPVDNALSKYNAERAAQIEEGAKRAQQEAAATSKINWPEEDTAISAAFKESAKYSAN